MKKLLITFALSAIFLLGIALIVKHNAEAKYQNIFDEIYYGEESIFHIPYGSSSFENIPGIKKQSRKDYKFDDSVYENYTDNTTIDKRSWSIWFSFDFPEKMFSISFASKLQEDISFYVVYEYFKSKHLLVERVYVNHIITEYEEKTYRDINTVKQYLDEAGIPLESIKKASEYLLYDKVIADWTRYTTSNFSKENMGKVTIERSPLFEE